MVKFYGSQYFVYSLQRDESLEQEKHNCWLKLIVYVYMCKL